MRAAVVLVACVSLAQAAPRPGKVVRIERHARRFAGDPRMCQISLESMQAYCYGRQPELNAKLVVVDATHLLGTLTVDKVEPLGSCRGAQSTLWSAHLKSSGDALVAQDSAPTGLLDVTVDPRNARMVKADDVPADRTPEQATAVDLDGDGRADLEFIGFTCDDNNNPVNSLSATTSSPSQCIEVWAARGRDFERLRTDRISSNCY